MPLLLLLPVLTFVLILSGVRSRRATANTATLGMVATLAAVGLIAWARSRLSTPYVATFQWVNIPVSFSGAAQFQGFGIDISLRVDHVALAATAAVLLVSIGVISWYRFVGRGEAGPARLHAELALAAAAAIGVIVSGDLAAMAAWWGVCGAASYLLLAHRWGTEAAGRASRLGLWLPFAGDLALWCGVAVIYSRFGELNLDRLVAPGILHGTYGAGLKSIGVAAVLFALAALVRGGVFPFSAWTTALEAPPAVSAWMQGIWPLTALVMLVRVLPIFNAAGPQPYRIFAILCALGAALGIVLALLVNDLRRLVAWAGSAAVALAMLGLGQPGALATSVAGMLAISLARPVLAGTAWAVSVAMRSGDLLDMGETWTRMRRTSLAFLLSAAAIAIAIVPKAAARASDGWAGSWFLAPALLLLGMALLRPYAVFAHGRLRRRRAFEPTRVREVAPGAAAAALAESAAAALAVLLAFLTPWITWFGGPGRAGRPEQLLIWLAVAAAGCALGAGIILWRRDPVLAWSARSHAAIAALSGLAVLVSDRFLRQPATGAVAAAEGGAVEAGGAALGRSLNAGGGWIRSSALGVAGGALGLALLAIAAAAALAGVLAGAGR